jgi:perosamine synthetase
MDFDNFQKNVKSSFSLVKKDIEDLKKGLEEIKKSSLDIPEIKKKSDKKIYTSKVFVNKDMLNAVAEVLNSGIFVLGDKTKEFEKKFAEFTHSKYAVAVNNGTVAIEVALMCLGIKAGDEIIVPSHTTVPTIEPILKLGAKPVFVDIDEKTFTIDAKKIMLAITKKTKAIMPVHLYGQAADMKKIKDICNKFDLFLVEDCAQAHNVKFEGKHVGTFGDVGCFSFYPTKNLTVCGEGGMIITDNKDIEEKARMLISHGEKSGERYNHVILGNNYRLSEIHCAIGIKQLELLPYFTKRRNEIAKKYKMLLKDTKIILPYQPDYSSHCYHLFVIRVAKEKRDKIIEEMKKNDIYLGIHYPRPCHMQKVVTDRFKQKNLPVTEKIVKEIISLPMYPELKDAEVELICKKLKELV